MSVRLGIEILDLRFWIDDQAATRSEIVGSNAQIEHGFQAEQKKKTVYPNSEVGEHTRPGCSWPRLAASFLRSKVKRTFKIFLRVRVFREGAENCTRGACAPVSISDLYSFRTLGHIRLHGKAPKG